MNGEIPEESQGPKSQGTGLKPGLPSASAITLQIGGHCEDRRFASPELGDLQQMTPARDDRSRPRNRRLWNSPPFLSEDSLESLEPTIRQLESMPAPVTMKREFDIGEPTSCRASPALSKSFRQDDDEDEDLDWFSRVMSKPRHFKGTRPASWIAQMELYMDRRRVPEKHKLTVATSYLDERTMDWYAIALGNEGQPKDWEESKATLLRHFSAHNYRQAKDRLGRIRQTGSVQEYLLEFKEALAECPGLPETEKKELFIDGLKPAIALNIRGQEDPSMKQIIDLAVRMSYEAPRHAQESRRDRRADTQKLNKADRKRQSSDSEDATPRRNSRKPWRTARNWESGTRHRRNYWMRQSARGVQERNYATPGDGRPPVRRQTSDESNENKRPAEGHSLDLKTYRCRYCGETGHLMAECPRRSPKN